MAQLTKEQLADKVLQKQAQTAAKISSQLGQSMFNMTGISPMSQWPTQYTWKDSEDLLNHIVVINKSNGQLLLLSTIPKIHGHSTDCITLLGEQQAFIYSDTDSIIILGRLKEVLGMLEKKANEKS